MAAPTDVLSRIDEIEGELRGLSAELHELRALVTQAAVAPVAEPTPAAGHSSHPWQPVAPIAPQPVDPAARLEAAIVAARIHLSEGERSAALDELERAIEFSRTDPRLCAGSNRSSRESPAISRPCERGPRELAETARVAAREAERARDRSSAAPVTPPDAPAPPHAPVAPRPSIPATAGDPGRSRPGPRRTAAQLAADWDLLGPRGFAIIGGAVTAFGIILLFVLAANRGWITPAMRVAFGACVSAAAVGVAFWVRSRYGQLQMSLGAAGAGIAGGYATLAAAAARYDLVPDWLALPLAGGLAAVAVVIAIAWSSETVAAIGLLGAALAPALQAIDTGLSWPSVAFAVIILAATVALAVPRRWHELLIGIGVVVGAPGCTARSRCRCVGGRRHDRRRRLVRAGRARGGGLAAARLRQDGSRSARELVRARRGRPRAPARAAALGRRPQPGPRARRRGRGLGRCLDRAPPRAACPCPRPRCLVALACRRRDRRPAVGNEPGDHLGGRGAAAVLRRPAGSRCAPAGNRPRLLRHHRGARAPRRCAAEARLRGARSRDGRGLRRRAGARASRCRHPRARRGGGAHRDRAARLARSRPRLARGAPRRAAGGPRPRRPPQPAPTRSRSCSPPTRSAPGTSRPRSSPRPSVPLAVAISARRGSVELVAASLAWVGGVFAIATGFDVPEFAVEAIHRSYGGWALIAASAGVLAACFAFQLLFRGVRHTGVPAGGGVLALAGSAAGIALISPAGDVLESTWIGWRLLVPTLVFLGLSASVFRIPRHRDLATIMWALGAVALLGSEWLVVARRDVARRCLRGHRGRPRPALPAPAGAAALARRLDRRVRDGIRHHRRPRRDLGDRRRRADALRDRGARGHGRPRWSSARSPGETRRGAISSPSPGRPRSSR